MTKISHFFRIVVCFFGLLVTTTACQRPVANPEYLDPIYSDLKSKYEAAKSSTETEKKTLNELVAEIDGFEPRDPRMKRSIRERFARERRIRQLEQESLYFEIRMEQRKAFVQKDYLKAFEAGKPWPDPTEIESYKIQQKLQNASRNWQDRVPRSDRYNSSKVGQMSKRAPAESDSAEKSGESGEKPEKSASSNH